MILKNDKKLHVILKIIVLITLKLLQTRPLLKNKLIFLLITFKIKDSFIKKER